MPGLSIQFDQEDIDRLTAFMEGLKDRLDGPTARKLLTPILVEHLVPIAQREQSILDPHNKSGALSASLVARSGRGDRDNTISAFIAPTAADSVLQSTWGLKGRSQQKGWALKNKGKRTRTRVFYGPIVHQGRAAAGDAGGAKVTEPIPFAADAVDALGDQESEAAAQDILDVVWGKEE